ncbi:MAG: hypothetical protein ABSD44_15380, partial [Terracidiphilus sp.]
MKGASRKAMALLGLLLAVVLGVGGRALAADTALTVTGAETMVGGVWDTGALTISFTDSTGNSYSETAGGPGPRTWGPGMDATLPKPPPVGVFSQCMKGERIRYQQTGEFHFL